MELIMVKVCSAHKYLCPVILLLVGLLVSAYLANWRYVASQQKAQDFLQQETKSLAEEIENKFSVAAYGLLGTQGMIAALGGAINHAQFLEYVRTRNLAKQFPGIRGFGFIEPVPVSEINAYEAQARKKDSPEFVIHHLAEPSDNDIYVIRFIEPAEQNKSALGLNLGSEPNRLQALLWAVDKGVPTLTSQINLVQDQKNTPGLLLYVPVYSGGAIPETVAQRRRQLQGLVYAPIVIAELLDSTAKKFGVNLSFSLHEAGDPEAWFDNKPQVASDHGNLSFKTSLVVYNRSFELTTYLHKTIQSSYVGDSHLFDLGLGSLLSLALSCILYLLLNAKNNAEVKANRQNLLLQDLVEHSPYGIIVYDNQQKCVLKNTACDLILNLPEYLRAQPHLQFRDQVQFCYQRGDYGYEKSEQDTIEYFMHAMQTRQHLGGKRKQGNGTWVEFLGTPISNNLTLITYFDITQLKQAEFSANVFEQLVHSSSDAIICKTLEGVITMWNKGAETLFGYHADEIIGEKIERLFRDEDLDKEAEVISSLARGEIIPSFECKRVRKDGTVVEISATMSPIIDSEGKVMGAAKIARDITSQKQYEYTLIRTKQAAEEANLAKSADESRITYPPECDHWHGLSA